jgi:hypothetical protein
MKFEKLNLTQHYNEITELWKDRDLDIAKIEILSEFGIVAKKEDKVVGVIFLYLTLGTPVSLLRFPVIDKNLNKDEHETVINGLIKNTMILSKQLGYNYSLCTTNHKGLIKRLKSHGYSQDADNCVHMNGVL